MPLSKGARKEAVRKDIVSSNPVEKVTLPKKKKFLGVAYTMEETRTLLNCSGDDLLCPAIVLGLFYGLRRSEVLGLRRCDINFESESVRIASQKKLPHIRFHDLQHTEGSLLLEDGVEIKAI